MHELAFPLLAGLIVLALAFDFLNGLHDAANSIATVVATRLLRPVQAVMFAAFFNFAAYFLSLAFPARSEEHTSELQSLMRLSYAVFCLKKKKTKKRIDSKINRNANTSIQRLERKNINTQSNNINQVNKVSHYTTVST